MFTNHVGEDRRDEILVAQLERFFESEISYYGTKSIPSSISLMVCFNIQITNYETLIFYIYSWDLFFDI